MPIREIRLPNMEAFLTAFSIQLGFQFAQIQVFGVADNHNIRIVNHIFHPRWNCLQVNLVVHPIGRNVYGGVLANLLLDRFPKKTL